MKHENFSWPLEVEGLLQQAWFQNKEAIKLILISLKKLKKGLQDLSKLFLDEMFHI